MLFVIVVEKDLPQWKIRIEKTLGTDDNYQSPNGISIAKRILLGKPLRDGYGLVQPVAKWHEYLLIKR